MYIITIKRFNNQSQVLNNITESENHNNVQKLTQTTKEHEFIITYIATIEHH
jgi:hypothetical protein